MKLFLKRHFTSLAYTRHTSSTPARIIQLCRSDFISDAVALLNSLNPSFQQQQNGINTRPILYATIIQACTKACSFVFGLQLHCFVLKSGLETDRFVGNSLLALYFKLGPNFTDTRKFFDGMYYKDVVSWTSIISGYIHAGKPRNSVLLYLEMIDAGIEPNAFTVSAVVRASGELRELNMGKCLHAVVLKFGFEMNHVIISTLIDMYGRNNEPGDALKMFEEMSEPDFICWTTVISALTRSDLYADALQLFYSRHRYHGFLPDGYTFGSILTALGNLGRLKQGKEVHAQVLTSGFYKNNIFVGSSLVDMYAKCGLVNQSHRVFNQMNKKNSVSRCALLGGYCQNGEFETVVQLFRNMEIDLYSFGTVIRACAGLSAVKLGKEVHCQYLKRGGWKDVVVESALVDLYAKCGLVDSAYRIFEKMSFRNLITWNSMISGFAQNGRGGEAVRIFNEMIRGGVEPDYISFIGVLFSCSHSGLVDQGRKYFISMSMDYGIEAGLEHYSCMVDLLGRAGQIEEAEDLIKHSQFSNDSSLWASLLGACTTNTRPIIAERIAKKLMGLRPDYHLSYVHLANAYRAVGRWDDAHKIWKKMQRKGVRKTPGTSWIENNSSSSFSFYADLPNTPGEVYQW